MELNNENLEENAFENQNNEEYENNYHYASPEFFIKIIPNTITKEKFENFYTELYLRKLSSIQNLLEVEPKSSSQLQNYLIFISKIKKQFYVGAGKVLINIKPADILENIDYFSLRSWCQCSINKSIEEWPSHIYTLAHCAYIKMINSQKDQAISLLGKIGTGKTFNTLKIIQYLFFISSNQEIKRDQYDLVNKSIKLMQLIGNIYKFDNVENNACGFVFHIGFQNNDICSFDIDSEILDITLPFSENGRSLTLLHGFLKTQEQYFKIKHADFNFFKKYSTIFKENYKEEYEYYEKRDIENFKIFTELCQVFVSENEYIDILNLLYVILLCNQVTILRNYRFIKGQKKEVYFVGEDGIIHRIANILGVETDEIMSIFFDDVMDYSLEKHKNILVAFMKYSYYCLHDFVLNKIKEKLKSVFNVYNLNKSNSKDNNQKPLYIHIIDFPGEKRDQTLGGMTLNYASECLNLYSISNYTSMLSCLENNNIRLKQFQAPVSFDIMKSLVNCNGILTFLNSDSTKQSIKFEELLTKSDNIPTIIQFIKKKQLINVNYTYLNSCYFFKDLLKESKTLIINKNMIKLFKNCNNIILSQTTLVTNQKHFYISEYINNKLKYLFCGIENIEPFIVNCISFEEIINEDNNSNFNIFNEKRDIIKNSLNWTWYGYEEWITFENFIEEFYQDFINIKNHYLYNKDINKSKRESKKIKNNSQTNENVDIKGKIEEIIYVFNLNKYCILGTSFLIMKKGTFNLLKRIEKSLLNNTNSSFGYEFALDMNKAKNLPIPKKILVKLLKQHQERKESMMKKNKEKKRKETEKSQNTYRENEKELYIPDNKIINLNIISDNINYILNNDKNCNYYHINNVLNMKKVEDKNKNNIVIPKSQNEYQNIKDFFDINNQFESKLYDISTINKFIIFIQKMYRGYIMRKKFIYIYKYVRNYVILLQKYLRGYVLRAKYSRFLNCLKKIVLLQLFYKNYYLRKEKAAIFIQRYFRKFYKKKVKKIQKNYQNTQKNRKFSKINKIIPTHINPNKKDKSSSTIISDSKTKKNKLVNKNSANKKAKNTMLNKDKSNSSINKSKEEIDETTKKFLQETNPKKIINALLYNKNFMIEADEKFNTDYYRTIYKAKYVYPYLRTTKNNEPKLEDRLIQYGEDKKLQHLLNNFKFHEDESKKCSFQPKINDNYDFEDSFYERNLKFMKAKVLKLEYNKIKEDEVFKYECTFRPKINKNNKKRTLNDLFQWQEKINKEKEEMRQLYDEFVERQIQNLTNFKPKDNYYSNMKYLERMAEKKGKIEKSEEGNDDGNNIKVKEIDSKSSNLSSNGYIDIGTPYDVWPLHLKKNFP